MNKTQERYTMKKLSLTSLGIFAAAMVIFSTNVTVSHGKKYKVCGMKHECVSLSKMTEGAIACTGAVHNSFEECSKAAKRF